MPEFAQWARGLETLSRANTWDFEWTEQHQKAFDHIKGALQTATLRNPDFEKEFIVQCDEVEFSRVWYYDVTVRNSAKQGLRRSVGYI